MTEPKSCLDCVNFFEDVPDAEDGLDGYCRLADYPAVIEFVEDPNAWNGDDMSACPCFVEDL